MPDTPASILEHPVWYEPLRSPSWLLPKVEPDAPLVVFVAAGAPDRETDAERDLREGLPMYLAEAVRYSTVARTGVATDATVPDEAIAVEVDASATAALVARLRGPRGEDLGTVTQAVDGNDVGRAIVALPGAIVAALRPAGVRSAWSTVFQPPADAHAADAIRGYAVCRFLLDPTAHRDVAADSEETARRRAAVDAALRRLADLSGRVTSPSASMLFFAGLAGCHDHGDPAYLGYRLSANGRCTTATDPRDPIFRISVLVFRLLGDPVIAGQRTRALASIDDVELRRWLARIDGVRSLA
ncbi:MAG TPA: hypothetical protein VLA82_04780 [Actinomycetota bacterium]|nr:hypothetical protein [Actinomycetota bacterium]